MSKASNFIEIGGYTYKHLKSPHPFNFKGDIRDCYTRPSNTKVNIYEWCKARVYDIEKFFNFDTCYEYGVYSYNCMMFTFGANFYKNGELVATYYETKTRRELAIKEGYPFNV